jgi:ribosomal-protein-serine acetyltransferase
MPTQAWACHPGEHGTRREPATRVLSANPPGCDVSHLFGDFHHALFGCYALAMEQLFAQIDGIVNHDGEFTDGVIVLRPTQLAQAEEIYQAISESVEEVSRWMVWCHEGYQLQESIEFLKKANAEREAGTAYAFSIYAADAAEGGLLGGCGLNFIDRDYRRANLGYWIRTSATGQGVATRAAQLVARFGFEQQGLERIEIVTDIDNTGSQRVAAKVGAYREGLWRKRVRHHDTQRDAIGFSLTREDLPALIASTR